MKYKIDMKDYTQTSQPKDRLTKPNFKTRLCKQCSDRNL